MRSLGDSILGLSSVSYLKKVFPKAKVVYGIYDWVYPLYENTITEADALFPLSFKTPSSWWRHLKFLRMEKFDLIIELHQRGSSRKFFNISPMFVKTPYFYHNHHLKKGGFVLDQGVVKASIQRDLDGLWPVYRQFMGDWDSEKFSTTEKGPPHYLDFPPRLELQGFQAHNDEKRSQGQTTIVLGVAARESDKVWPLKYFNDLCRLLIAKNKDSRIVIPLSNTPFHSGMYEKLQSYALPPQVTFSHVPLNKLPEFLYGASLYIGNDTGDKHLCAALGMRTYTIFNNQDPEEWHPYELKNHRFFHRNKNLEGNLFTGEFDPGKGSFLEQLKPEDVFSQLRLD